MNAISHRVWFNQIEATVDRMEHPLGSTVVFSEQNPTLMTDNQDASGYFSVNQHSLVLAVVDGMGGAPCGGQAAHTIINTLTEHLTPLENHDAVRTAVLDAIEDANQRILQWGVGAGATLVLAIVTSDGARIIHVGDAEALLCSNRGRIKFSTISHAPVAMALEIGVIDELSAIQHHERNIINNFVGSREMRIEIGPQLKLRKFDTLLLATDGLFDNLLTNEILETIRCGKLDRRSHHLLDMARQRMRGEHLVDHAKPDDLTVLMFSRGS